MLHLNIKPQNQGLVVLIFALGGLWGVFAIGRFKGFFEFIIDGTIILVITVLLGNLTNLLLRKLGFRLFEENPIAADDILDVEPAEESPKQTEDQKDKAALVYAALWAGLLVLLAVL